MQAGRTPDTSINFVKSIFSPNLPYSTRAMPIVIANKHGPAKSQRIWLILMRILQKLILGLIGCILCGFSVGIMWPGSISITVPRIPKGGTALFALLAVAGDMGGAFGPSMVGYFSQQAGDNLQVGLLTGCTFPLIMLAALIAMRKMAKND